VSCYRKFTNAFIWNACYFCPILSKLESGRKNFRKILHYKISPKSAHVIQCGWTDRRTDRQTDIMKLIVALQNFTSSPNEILVGLTTTEFLLNIHKCISFYICKRLFTSFVVRVDLEWATTLSILLLFVSASKNNFWRLLLPVMAGLF
jgi:hypothetical protein